MAGYKDNALERRNASIAAKQALLTKYKSQPGMDDPSLQQKLEERRQLGEARAVRMAERKREQEVERARQAVIKEAELVAKRAAEEEELQRQLDQVAREEMMREEKKAARDARYAARKARVMKRLR